MLTIQKEMTAEPAEGGGGGGGVDPPERNPDIQVVRVEDAHAESIAEFFRAAWGSTATTESVRAAWGADAISNPVEPGAGSPAFVFLSDGKALGYIGTIPTRLWNGSRQHSAHWLKGFMVLPEHRHGPIGYLVLKEAMRHLGLAAVLTVAPPSRRLFQALGFTDLGALGNHVLLLRPGRVLRTLDVNALGMGSLPSWMPRAFAIAQRSGLAAIAGGVIAASLGAWRLARGSADGRFAIRAGRSSSTPMEIDSLWCEVRAGIGAASVRDGAYLLWRYGPGLETSYEILSAREGDALVGVAVVRRPQAESDPRLRGIRVATLSDLLVAPGRRDAMLAILAGAERTARALGADALLASVSHPALGAALTLRGYVALPGNVHFLLRDPKGVGAFSGALTDWWITRGDANSDETF